jgi:hypothetical protein
VRALDKKPRARFGAFYDIGLSRSCFWSGTPTLAKAALTADIKLLMRRAGLPHIGHLAVLLAVC